MVYFFFVFFSFFSFFISPSWVFVLNNVFQVFIVALLLLSKRGGATRVQLSRWTRDAHVCVCVLSHFRSY
jgi:uncharacterized membrane protein